MTEIERADLEARIAELEELQGKLEARIEELEARNAELEQENEHLRAEAVELIEANRRLADVLRLSRQAANGAKAMLEEMLATCPTAAPMILATAGEIVHSTG